MGVLKRQVDKLSAIRRESVTFEELYWLTRIELDVVAVDLKRQRLVIFNYALTPKCSVGEAVVASDGDPGSHLNGGRCVSRNCPLAASESSWTAA